MRSHLPKTAKFLALVLGIVAAMAASSPASAATANAYGAEMFGISDGGQMQTEDATSMNRDLDAMAAAGARWLRVDIYWAPVQAAGPDSYDWSGPDRLSRRPPRAGSRSWPSSASPRRGRGPPGRTPYLRPDPANYAAFAAKAAAHYAPMGVHAYEIWNEPNIGLLAAEARPRRLHEPAQGRLPGDQGRRSAGRPC